jgi:hypothetical protein
MGSGAMIYIPSFIKTESCIEKLIEDIQIHRQHGDLVSLLSFFQNKERRLKRRPGTKWAASIPHFQPW